MINIIVPITEKVEKFEEFLEIAKKNHAKDAKIFVGITKKLEKNLKIDKDFAEINVFADGSNVEQMINSLHACKLKKGKIMVVRRPLTVEEFESLISSEKDIAVLKRKRKGIVEKFKRMISSLVRKVFAFNYFEDISAISYNENLFNLLSVCANFSMATRVNRYVGLEIDEIETEEKQVKKIYNKAKNALRLVVGSFFFLASIAGVVCISIFCKINALIVLLFILWLFVATATWLICLLNFTRTITVGQLRWGKAQRA